MSKYNDKIQARLEADVLKSGKEPEVKEKLIAALMWLDNILYNEAVARVTQAYNTIKTAKRSA